MGRLVRHVGALWPSGGWLLPWSFVAWAVARLCVGPFRWELAALAIVMPALAYDSARSRRLFLAVFPLALLGLTYDAMRFARGLGVTAARVHDCDLRAVESAMFGRPGWTVHDWLQAHPSAALDRLCAVPYGTYLFVTVGFAIFLHARAPASAVTRFSWAFFASSLLGFVTYHVYPAAPPWYFHAHGCAVDLSTAASAGPNLTRVDAWLGFPFFRGLYARSTDVFGSVPSLHVAYPLLIVLEGWPWLRPSGRAAAVVFAAWMAFAAVYLDHHWIVDVVAGWLDGAIAYAVVRAIVTRASRRAVTLSPAVAPARTS